GDALHPVRWVIYALTVAIGLYSHLFFGLVAIGHGIYVLAIEGFRFSKKVLAYLLASLTGLLIFSPWLLIIAANLSQILQSTATTNSTVRNLPLRWLLNLSRLFFDLNHGLSLINPILYLTAILSIWGVYFVCRNTPKQTWLFILTLIGVAGLALILPDLILGGRRSSVTRYAIPCFLGIQVAVAYLLAVKIHVKRWSYVLVALVASGVISCIASSFFPVWWHNSHTNSKYNLEVARIVNQAERPLLVTDEIPGRVLAFSHLLKPDVNLQLVVEPNIPKIADNFGNVFLYRPSERWRQGIEQDQSFKIDPVYKDWLWKISKKA
ncbi:MAG TPA: dolichyl-phosphate-mannose-protein mannosyltransferase, partial [Cyanobacteria bacterium UBA11372]|nr:dolichyl-phosphate-mannose-protein mannosyltransferase [Cyanobacteria bacterium UBA11372]HBE30526.1 dolichyl-phosphate-mannose-protein mannosyltransferase [Cyanobacteria bacterium UBA11368]